LVFFIHLFCKANDTHCRNWRRFSVPVSHTRSHLVQKMALKINRIEYATDCCQKLVPEKSGTRSVGHTVHKLAPIFGANFRHGNLDIGLTECVEITGTGSYRSLCPSGHPTNSVSAVKETQSTEFNQRTGFLLSSTTTDSRCNRHCFY